MLFLLFLCQITPELLFSNLRSIISAHQQYWQEVIYPMLQEVRRTGKPFDPLRLEAGCLQVTLNKNTFIIMSVCVCLLFSIHPLS